GRARGAASIRRVTETQVPPRQRPAGLESSAAASRARGPITVIRPASRWPRLDVRELWRYRELLVILIWRDLKVRYKQTVIGAGWAVFQPVMTAVVYSLIFGKFAKFPSASLPYPIFAFSGILAMQYFSGALNIS